MQIWTDLGTSGFSWSGPPVGIDVWRLIAVSPKDTVSFTYSLHGSIFRMCQFRCIRQIHGLMNFLHLNSDVGFCKKSHHTVNSTHPVNTERIHSKYALLTSVIFKQDDILNIHLFTLFLHFETTVRFPFGLLYIVKDKEVAHHPKMQKNQR